MRTHTYTLYHGRVLEQDEWGVRLVTHSPIRQVVSEAVAIVCAWTGHRMERLNDVVSTWAFKAETVIIALPVTEAQAEVISPDFVAEVREWRQG